MQGDPLRKKISKKKSEKKCLAVPKKIERGDSLVSPGMICYAEKQVKPFWSSSLGQMVLFDTIIFCRTFKNYFGQFVWIEKKRVTIIVAFHFMKRRLKKVKFSHLLFIKLDLKNDVNFAVTDCKCWTLASEGPNYKTRRERLKSALYLRLKQCKAFFLEKKLEISFFFLQGIVPKNVKGGPFWIY